MSLVSLVVLLRCAIHSAPLPVLRVRSQVAPEIRHNSRRCVALPGFSRLQLCVCVVFWCKTYTANGRKRCPQSPALLGFVVSRPAWFAWCVACGLLPFPSALPVFVPQTREQNRKCRSFRACRVASLGYSGGVGLVCLRAKVSPKVPQNVLLRVSFWCIFVLYRAVLVRYAVPLVFMLRHTRKITVAVPLWWLSWQRWTDTHGRQTA